MPNGALAVVTLPHISGLEKDAAVNTLAFSPQGGSTAAFLTDVVANIIGFFNDPVGPVSATVGSMIGEVINRNEDATIELYDLSGPLLGSPIGTQTFSLPPPAGSAMLPSEVALCLSFKGLSTTTQEARRRRGRIYLGPLDGSVMGGSGTAAVGRPSSDAIETLASAGSLLNPSTSGDSRHCVWSRADDALHPVWTYWCDNEFDTQRRRGNEATARATGFVV